MSGKANILRIFIDHSKTLRATNGTNPSAMDWCFFYVIPLIVAALIAIKLPPPNENFFEAILTASSIFSGLLLNLLILLYDLTKKNKEELKETPGNDFLCLKRDLLRALTANISYAICIAIALIVFTVFVMFAGKSYPCMKLWLCPFVYFLSIHFILTIMIVLKRVYALLSTEHI